MWKHLRVRSIHTNHMQEKAIKALALIVALPLACTPHSLTFVNGFSWLSSSSLRQTGKSFSFVLHGAHARTLGGRCLEESGRSFSRVREADPAGLKLDLFVPGILLGSRLTGSFWLKGSGDFWFNFHDKKHLWYFYDLGFWSPLVDTSDVLGFHLSQLPERWVTAWFHLRAGFKEKSLVWRFFCCSRVSQWQMS